MGRHDWYRNTDWNSEIQSELFARWSRSKTSLKKAKYLRIQGWYLIQLADPQVVRIGLALTQRVLDEFPDRKSERSSCLHAIGHAYRRLRDFDQAIEALRAAWAFERLHPGVITQARVELALLLIELDRRDCVEEICDAADPAFHKTGELMFPILAVRLAFIRAVAADWQGRPADAAAHARDGLAAAGATAPELINNQRLQIFDSDHPMMRRLRQFAGEK